MNKKVSWTKQFHRDYKKLMKEGQDIELLDEVIRKLASGKTLEQKYHDHELKNDWKGHRECLVQPDWYLVYRITEDSLILTLTRLGYHEDLFGSEDII